MPHAPFLSNLCGAGSTARDNLLPCDVFDPLAPTLQERKAGQKDTFCHCKCAKIHTCEMYTIPTPPQKTTKPNHPGVLRQVQIVRHAFLHITSYFPW